MRAVLTGLEPERMPIIQEAVKRGLGEGNIERIQVVGNSIESFQERFGLC